MSERFSCIKIFARRNVFIPTTIAIIAATSVQAQEADSGKTLQLPQITVTAEAESDGNVSGYKTGTTRSSTHTDTPLLDVPQSISVVTQDQIRDQNITSVAEAIRYVPGVTVHQGENNRDQVIFRGNSSSADFFIDGARDDMQYYRDFYNIDRIEVLKGPNAMAFGRGGSGGAINRISKFADGNQVRQVVISGGSFNNRRIQGDLGDKVNDVLALRLNTMYEKSGTFRDYGDLERYGFNPTATLTLGKRTDLKLGYEYFHDKRFNDRGIPSSNGAPYRTNPSQFFGNPNQNYADATVKSEYATLTHNFTPKTQLRNNTRYTENYKFYQNTFPGSAVGSDGKVTLSAYNNALTRNNFVNQTDLTQKFKTGSIDHTALLGMEITTQKSKTFRNTGYFNNSASPFNVSADNPITYAPVTYRQSATDANNNSDLSVYSGYIQDQVDINKYLQLTGGLRYDTFKLSFHDNRSGANASRTDRMVSPRAGVVVKPQDNVSLYGSYSVSYLPSSGDQFSTLTAQTQALKPERIRNYEIGSKWDVTKALNVSAAVYQLDRFNTRATDPTNPANLVLTGASRTRGIELGTTGKITSKWQIIGGYALQNAVITKTTTTAAAGAKVALVPKHMGSLWNKYDFTQEWAAALGIITQSGQFAAVDNTVKLKGFTRFDGAVYYKINPQYRLQLNVENLLNRKYIQTADGNNNLQPGSPHAFRLALMANF